MLFNSWDFLFFFPLVVLAYYLTPARWRWILLFISSCYFYMAAIPVYILVLFALILLDFTAGIFIERAKTQATKKTFLILSLIGNLGILFSFKYYNWIVGLLEGYGIASGNLADIKLSWALPIGLSFHTFQSIAYTIEVYKGRFAAETHLGRYAVYVLFFPQMVAGPIERPQRLLPQLRKVIHFRNEDGAEGLRLMLRGFAKKSLIADNLAGYVDTVFSVPQTAAPESVFLATLFFSVQIYCDFSGYSDIAIGSARILGIQLSPNFIEPYMATSIRDFWRRWHISLSTWFRDYVYIPLGGNRTGEVRHHFNLFVVFLLSGLWHGANWTFVVWGALHGAFLMIGDLLAKVVKPSAWSRLAARVSTLICVGLAWIFFRADSVRDALTLIERLVTFDRWWSSEWSKIAQAESVPFYLLLIAGLAIYERFFVGRDISIRLMRSPAYRWSLYYAAVVAILLLGKFDLRQFIYFQF